MSTAELSQTEIMGAQFREGIRARGGLVVGDSATDRETLRRAGVAAGTAKAPDERPGYIEIDAADGERVIVIRERDGTRHELRPFLSYGNAKKIPFYARQLEKFQTQLEETENEEQYLEILTRAGAMEERMMRLAIPDLPDGLLDRLETSTLAQLKEATARLRDLQGHTGKND